MRLSELILVLGPIVLIAFALGLIDAAFIRLLVITAVVAAAGYWIAVRLAGTQKKRGRSGEDRRDRDGPEQ
jgi:hypothetical protein